MGSYILSAEEILIGVEHSGIRITFEGFLRALEGDVSAEELAKAWNILAKKYRWDDRLEVNKVSARRGK